MGSSNDQPYKNQLIWIPIATTQYKQILQNKQNRKFIEKHWWKFQNLDEANKLNWVYEWRCNTKKVKHPIEIYSMGFEDPAIEASKGCTYDMCVNAEIGTSVVIYTQKIYKLYEYNPKIEMSPSQQMNILIDIVESIDSLSKKFGTFEIGKEMIGYTPQCKGRAWYNDNLARNDIQKKYQTNGEDEKIEWQQKIIQNIIDIASMCVNSKSSYQSKFSNAINQIQSKQLYSFKSIINQRKIREGQSQQKRIEKSPFKELRQSKLSPIIEITKRESLIQSPSDYLKIVSAIDPCSSTTRAGPYQKQSSHHQIRQSTKRVVMIPVAETTKIYSIGSNENPIFVRRTYHHPENRSSLSSSPSQSLLENTFSQSPDNRQLGNLVQVHNSRYTNPSEFQQSTSIPLRQHSQPRHKQNPNHNSHQHQIYNRNGHLLQRIDEEVDSSKLINRMQEEQQQNIKMVDSMIFVGQEQISNQSDRGKSRMVLQESIILRGIKD